MGKMDDVFSLKTPPVGNACSTGQWMMGWIFAIESKSMERQWPYEEIMS